MKNYFLLVFAIGIFFISSSNNSSAQGFDVGIRLGANTPFRSDGKVLLNSWYKIGAVVGIQGDYWLTSELALNVQIIYVESKMTIQYPGPNTDAQIPPASFSHGYIEIPLVLKVGLGSIVGLRPYFTAGISVAALLFEYYDGVEGGAPQYPSTTDFGLLFSIGLAYRFPAGTSFFFDTGLRASMTGGEAPAEDLRYSAGILFPI